MDIVIENEGGEAKQKENRKKLEQVEIAKELNSSSGNNAKVMSVEAIAILPKRLLRSATKKPDQVNKKFVEERTETKIGKTLTEREGEQKTEKSSKKTLRKHRSWSKSIVTNLRNTKCVKSETGDKITKNNSNNGIDSNENSEFYFSLNKIDLIERSKTFIGISNVASEAGFQLIQRDSLENAESIESNSEVGNKKHSTETMKLKVKSVKTRSLKMITREKCFNNRESDSNDGNKINHSNGTSTRGLTRPTRALTHTLASASPSTCGSTCVSTTVPNNVSKQSNESDDWTRNDSRSNSKKRSFKDSMLEELDPIDLLSQSRNNDSLGVRVDKNKQPVEQIVKSIEISVSSLMQIESNKSSNNPVINLSAACDKDYNLTTKIVDMNSSSDSGHSSSESIDTDFEHSTNDSIEIELNNNADDKLIACLAGVDLLNVNIGMDYGAATEQNEQKSNENDGKSIQNEQIFIVNGQKSNDNTQEVPIEQVNEDDAINFSEELAGISAETTPLKLTYFVYQIPVTNLNAFQSSITNEMAIQTVVFSTSEVSNAICGDEVHDAGLISQTFAIDSENIELCETNPIIKNGQNFIFRDENTVTNVSKTTAKMIIQNCVTRSSFNSCDSKDPLKNNETIDIAESLKNSYRPTDSCKTRSIHTRRGRPQGSKNLKITNENLFSSNIFCCELCPDKIFKSRLGLKKHITRHLTNKMRQKCILCDQKPQNLEIHMKMKHSNVQHKCDYCDKSFKNKENQLIHMRTHTGERPYICGTCGMSFRAQATCRKHENRVHRFMKKFRCNDCGRFFHSPYLLEDHTYAFHTGERPYLCDLCGKHFSTRHYLRTHKITHGEKVHKCRYCEKMFALSDNRRKHERRFHKIK